MDILTWFAVGTAALLTLTTLLFLVLAWRAPVVGACKCRAGECHGRDTVSR